MDLKKGTWLSECGKMCLFCIKMFVFLVLLVIGILIPKGLLGWYNDVFEKGLRSPMPESAKWNQVVVSSKSSY